MPTSTQSLLTRFQVLLRNCKMPLPVVQKSSLINQEKEIDVEESENQFRNIEAGRVDINDVAFSYVPDRKLIENLNLHVKPGQRIAIVGPTGCGKLTINKSFDEIL